MIRRSITNFLLVLATISVSSFAAAAAELQWPDTLNMGGFSINSIRGSIASDGSGTASGRIEIPGMSSQSISLKRSPRGEITGVASLDGRFDELGLRGDFTLTDSGLKGKAQLGRAQTELKLRMSGSNCEISGETSAKDQVDTTLASYTFDGNIKIQGNNNRVVILANGTVQRNGKLSDQVSRISVRNGEVDPGDGSMKVTIDGVSVTFKLF